MRIHRNKQIESHPEFGNQKHIDYVKTWQAITAGEAPCGEMMEASGELEADTFKCPVCNTITSVPYYTCDSYYFKPVEFKCRSCKREYIIKSHEGQVYFKQPENTETCN